MRYNRKRAQKASGKKIRMLFHPRSLSGGSVFYGDKLCGVFIEYDGSLARAISTGIEVVVEIIRAKWSELDLLLPI